MDGAHGPRPALDTRYDRESGGSVVAAEVIAQQADS